MEIREIRALRGANYYSRYPVIYMQVALGELEEKPSDTIPGFKTRIEKILPSLIEHQCSPGHRGGFFERLDRGTWAGHIAEHIAIEIQCLAQMEVGFGKTYSTDDYGIYNIVYRYRDEEVGIEAGKYAVQIVNNLFNSQETDIPPIIQRLKEIRENNLFGPSTQSIVSEANNRSIPVIRLNDDSYVQLGYGIHQRRIQATIIDTTSAIGVEIADDKKRTKDLLSGMGIPVPKGYSVETLSEALEAAETIGYPVAIKPVSGNHGRGITTNILSPSDLETSFQNAKKFSEYLVVEKFLSGSDYRMLVIDGKFIAASRRDPASIVGDGKSTIQQLVNEINLDPNRGFGHEKILTRIAIDYMTERLLSQKQLTLQSIIPKDEKLYIKSTANLSAGGIAIDVTDEVHPMTKTIAERISQIVGLNVIGIDLITSDHRIPLSNDNGGVIEVNAAPGFRMHVNPFEGKSKNVAGAIVDMLFPPGSKFDIPIVAVTGTNGKTTTTRLISHIIGLNGNIVGMTSTDGIVFGNDLILEGDYSGPEGAKIVLRDASIDHAVLEVARGGIIRRGLGYEESDVAVVTNITQDHLGEGGINTLEELARLKGTIVEAIKPSGYAVLNADDDLVLTLKEKTKGRVILFSINHNNPELQKHHAEGHIIVTLIDGVIIIQQGSLISTVANVIEIPLTLNGNALFNVSNTLAAVGATYALGLNEKQIRAGVISFSPSIGQSPGRMNIIDMGKFKVMIDYSHNIGAVIATGKMLPFVAPGKKIRMAVGTGNRRTQDIIDFGESLAEFYDYVVIKDTDPRDRAPGETCELVKQGLLKAGYSKDNIDIIIDGREATQKALNMASDGDIVVLQADDIQQVIQDVIDYKEILAEEILRALKLEK
ncbi:MAG: cyanophycin synthetase [Bacteroidetes bacterium]|nr:cyanophycin synthetase [Bacteroidota bacterium]MBT4338147.1 cyanophycin synthetase [Bacteroidota bacterium]MBT4728447.1 cyanophycin synthetase [Bacteroidota bacterium]MBT5990934.1 cyanophycin synthetase [Bacteroidota bacterium]MBT7039359.1 cyanophycin synthetase [Bacteroidota bacterium]